jgi:hypothetical protein
MAKPKQRKQRNAKAKRGPARVPGPTPPGNKNPFKGSRKLMALNPTPAPRMAHKQAICSLTDPFCIHAKGAQRPDGGPPSIPFQLRVGHTITTSSDADQTTGQRQVYVPAIRYAVHGSASATATDWTMSATLGDLLGANFVASNAKEVRITSFGVIVRCPLSATAASGMLIISSYPNPTMSEVIGVQTLSNPETQMHSISAGMEISWRSKPLGPTAHIFRPASDYTTISAGFGTTLTNFDWMSCCLEVVGGPVTALTLSVEYVLNVEFTAGGTGGSTPALANLQRAPPKPNRTAVAAADHVHATVPSIIAGGIDYVGKKVEQYAMDALDSIMSDGLALLTL